MDTKLTLSLNKEVVNKAKEYVKKNRTSLSQLIENYLSAITTKEKHTNDISPLVKSLSGVVKLPKDFDIKKDKTKYLEQKYK
jgi:hypothetical protein